MPICKPTERTIRTADFRDNAYSFVVESTLDSDVSPGMVVISTSAGYLLTTSLIDEPKREQIIRYRLQPDDSWLATTVVTLLTAGESLSSGTVVIRDSNADTILLTIDAVTPSLKQPDFESVSVSKLDSLVLTVNEPVLTVSESVLTFAGTSTDRPSFQVITIAQQHSKAPVLLTTDAPDYFQLATDSHPAFAPSLTLTPSPAGTYVHVRYAANKYGTHTGQLTIHSSSGNETVILKGRNMIMLPTMIGGPYEQAVPRRRWVGLLASVLVLGLGYTGYSYRCEIFPDLCQEMVSNELTDEAPDSVISTDVSREEKEQITSQERTRVTAAEPTPIELPTAQASVNASADQSIERPVSDVSNKPYNVTKPGSVIGSVGTRKTYPNKGADEAVVKRPRQQIVTPVPVTEESDLERELNDNSRKQL